MATSLSCGLGETSMDEMKQLIGEYQRELEAKDQVIAEFERRAEEHERELQLIFEEFQLQQEIQLSEHHEGMKKLYQQLKEYKQKESGLDEVAIMPPTEDVDGLETADLKILNWKEAKPAPDVMTSTWGTAVVHGSKVYFSQNCIIYVYSLDNTWKELKKCPNKYFSLAFINDRLTTIGGMNVENTCVNTLLSLTGSGSLESRVWENSLPQMPTKRVRPAAITTLTHLVVVGGTKLLYSGGLSTVEVMDIKNQQWFTARSLPEKSPYPQLAVCGEYLYSTYANHAFSCSMKGLLQSCQVQPTSTKSVAVWNGLSDIPVYSESSLIVHGENVLALGGVDKTGKRTGAIYCYNKSTNSWQRVTRKMPTPRSHILAAVLPSTNELVVTGGMKKGFIKCNIIEIGQIE